MRIANFPNSAAPTTQSSSATASEPTPSSRQGSTSAQVKLNVSLSIQLDGFDAVGGANTAAGMGEDQLDSLANELVGMLCGDDDASVSSDSASGDSSAATGGLQKDPAGWPEGSVKTPGGYTVVPGKKDHAWSVYSPGQSPSDKPTSRIWGDPHVMEKDGTKWDFTKDSNFRLPDGTTILCDTSSDKGQSISKGLDIVSGDEHVSISGLDRNAPVTSAVGPASAEVKSRLQATQDTFTLGKDGDEVQWFRSRNGQVEGLVTGSTKDAENTYDQVIDRNVKPAATVAPVSPGGASPATAAQAALGSDAFEQQLMSELEKLLQPEGAAGQAAQPKRDVNTDATGDMKGLQELLQALKDLQQLIERLGAVQRPTAFAG